MIIDLEGSLEGFQILQKIVHVQIKGRLRIMHSSFFITRCSWKIIVAVNFGSCILEIFLYLCCRLEVKCAFRTWYFTCESKDEAEEWVQAFKTLCVCLKDKKQIYFELFSTRARLGTLSSAISKRGSLSISRSMTPQEMKEEDDMGKTQKTNKLNCLLFFFY